MENLNGNSFDVQVSDVRASDSSKTIILSNHDSHDFSDNIYYSNNRSMTQQQPVEDECLNHQSMRHDYEHANDPTDYGNDEWKTIEALLKETNGNDDFLGESPTNTENNPPHSSSIGVPTHSSQSISTVSNSHDSQSKSVAKRPPPNVAEVIDLLDDEDVANRSNDDIARGDFGWDGKRPRLATKSSILDDQPKNIGTVSHASIASYEGRQRNLPNWMPQHSNLNLPSSLSSAHSYMNAMGYHQDASLNYDKNGIEAFQNSSSIMFDVPQYIQYPANFTPTWEVLTPPPNVLQALQPLYPSVQQPAMVKQKRAYQLSLLNVTEFTITGLPPSWNAPPTSVNGLRAAIKKISREHGIATFQKDDEDPTGGKWRIPLGAYHAFLSYLKSDSDTQVTGVDPKQLQIASLEKQRQDKGYPEAKELIAKKVPAGLANALAPFQRGGVDFTLAKHGRALIADEMGLGKSIQGIASMAAYHDEWPLLVLCPSGARYHWEHEFRHWLGVKSPVNKDSTKKEGLLRDNQVHVVANAKNPLFPSKNTRVVIMSYGLAPTLIRLRKLKAGLFRCAIVDESHMLKNKSSQRTAALVPILQKTDRCVLLSGTPALARPIELWPQLSILRHEKDGLWHSESEFMKRYDKKTDSTRTAELHTMLRGTVMIRRLKSEVMQSMPKKVREMAEVYVVKQAQREEFKTLLRRLCEGSGTLAKLSKAHGVGSIDDLTSKSCNEEEWGKDSHTTSQMYEASLDRLNSEFHYKLSEGRQRILQAVTEPMSTENRDALIRNMENTLRSELQEKYESGVRKLNALTDFQIDQENAHDDGTETKKTSILSRLYGMTGDSKIPLVVEMLNAWIADTSKGKLCIFAHHISVLDAFEKLCGLTVGKDCIRIDGSTLPRQRQQHISDFQSKPEVRIALLGITAAGVAVTLTASSTVWFAELFWTPAIMIQAEDRCHRIGQQARVKCLYIVAKGTIDDLLWKLIEKKFKDLGEFVEGKEKLNLVVDNVYHGRNELFKMFESENVVEGDDEDKEDAEKLENLFQLDTDLVHTIEQLGREEELMLKDLDDDNDGEEKVEDSKLPVSTYTLGASEQAAIPLSDDDDENDVSTDTTLDTPMNAQLNLASALYDKDKIFPLHSNYKMYKILIGDTSLGVEVALCKKRIVIAKVTQLRLRRLGPNSKPDVGDILVAVNGNRLALVPDLQPVMEYLKRILQKPPIELTFVEIPTFRAKYLQQRQEKAVNHVASSTASSGAVIDLIDDD